MVITVLWLALWIIGLIALPMIATWEFEADNDDRVAIAFFWTIAVVMMAGVK